MKINDSRLKKIIEIVWVVVVLAAGTYYIIKNLDTVRGYFSTLPILLPILSFLLIMLSKLLIPRMAQLSVEFSEERFAYSEMLNIVSITQLGKYLPGGIWHFVGRFGVYQQRGIDKVTAGKLMLLENLWLVISAVGTALFLFQLSGPEVALMILGAAAPYAWVIWILIAACVGAIGIIPAVLFHTNKTAGYWLQLAACFIIIWVSYGISYAILLESLSLTQLFAMSASFDLSWAGGYLTVFAPAGLGVREVILSLFATALSIEEGPVISVFHRLIWTAVEIILGIISLLVKKVKEHEGHHTDTLPE